MTTTTTTAKTPDYDEIVRVVQLYVDGFKGDVDKFKEAFHEDAWIFFTDADGVLHKYLIADSIEEWAAGKIHIVGRIISVIQAGDVDHVAAIEKKTKRYPTDLTGARRTFAAATGTNEVSSDITGLTKAATHTLSCIRPMRWTPIVRQPEPLLKV